MDKQKIKAKEYIRWLGVASSIAILFILALSLGGRHMSLSEDLLHLLRIVGLVLLPAFVSVFTSLAKYFWPNLIIGLWFLFIGYNMAEPPFMGIILLAALALSSTPILNMIFFKKKIDKGNNSVKSE